MKYRLFFSSLLCFTLSAVIFLLSSRQLQAATDLEVITRKVEQQAKLRLEGSAATEVAGDTSENPDETSHQLQAAETWTETIHYSWFQGRITVRTLNGTLYLSLFR